MDKDLLAMALTLRDWNEGGKLSDDALNVIRDIIKWNMMDGMTTTKDTPMVMDSDNYFRIIAMRDELIFEQKDEIAKLKVKVNQLRLKLK
jgi:hypothetical protein